VPLVTNSFVVEGEVKLSLVGIPDTLSVTVIDDGLFVGIDAVFPIELRRSVVEGVVRND
jgi:hypothetical protein